MNPLLQPWTGFHGLPPFDRLDAAHFAPAFETALAEHLAELEAIAGQAAPPDFDNTIAAFEASGAALRRVGLVFHNLAASESTPALQAVEREMSPRLAAHRAAIYLDPRLFARIDELHEKRHRLGLDAEALRLLERLHLDFVLTGARLARQARERARQIAERLAACYTAFSQNLLADEAANTVRFDDGTSVPLSMSSVMDFLAASDRRERREAVWRAWTDRGRRGDARDNRGVAREILALRHELAGLHGAASYAEMALKDCMAGTPAAARGLLMRVWEPARRRAAEEEQALRRMVRESGGPDDLQPWDWRFHAERLRRERFRIDDAEVRPYFALEAMLAAMFDCAHRLFGLRFTEVTDRPDVPRYHPDVRAWEVGDAAGRPIALFLGDNFARPAKRGGAWMSVYRSQSRRGGQAVTPIVVNNNNFTRAPEGQPTLLNADDARTLFHEFGHGLHGMLSDATYERLAGTQVLRDFVELPSQLFEHWAFEPEVLRRHARHVVTGEPIPESLIERLAEARRFGQGHATVQQTGPALIDLALHEAGPVDDVDAFEAAQRQQLGVPEAVGLRHGLPHFRHLFASAGYAAGYYVYQWAEVLDEDAWRAFVEAGSPFDPAVADRLKRCVYAAGNTVDPGATYRAFRGRDPKVEPMLAARGLLEAEPAGG